MVEVFVFIGIVFLFIFNIYGFYFIKHTTQMPVRFWHRPVFFVLSFINTIGIALAGANNITIPFIYLLFFIILFFELAAIFRAEIPAILSSAASFVFHILCARALASSIVAALCGVSIYITQRDVMLRVVSLFLSLIMVMAVFKVYSTKWSINNIKMLFLNRNQLILNGTIEVVLLSYQILCSFSYHLVTKEAWFIVFHISSAVLCIVWHFLLTDSTIKYCVWVNQSFKTEILSEQINRQLIHYEAYEKHFESFRQFRANYDRLIGDVRHNITKGDIVKARELLAKANENVNHIESSRKQYCNNMLVDSILWDTACSAQSKNISFEAQLSLPEWLDFSEMEYCRIFANLCTNAIDASFHSKANPYIKFTSFVSGPWLTIIQENSFKNDVNFSSGKLITGKTDTERHGIGVSSIKDILEQHGGFAEIEVNNEEKIFKFIIHICEKSRIF